jgi:hypothetical protein
VRLCNGFEDMELTLTQPCTPKQFSMPLVFSISRHLRTSGFCSDPFAASAAELAALDSNDQSSPKRCLPHPLAWDTGSLIVLGRASSSILPPRQISSEGLPLPRGDHSETLSRLFGISRLCSHAHIAPSAVQLPRQSIAPSPLSEVD